MQPTNENNKQLSLFDMGVNEEELGAPTEKELEPKKPYEYIITLNELRLMLDKDYSLLMASPVLSTSKTLIKWTNKDLTILNEEALETTSYTILETTDEQEIESLRESDTLLQYIINFFYDDPKETYKDKVEIIKNLKKLRHPKKYIYDVINKTEEIVEADPLELALLVYPTPFITNNTYWRYIMEPTFKRQFTAEGLKEIKAIYKKACETQKGENLELRALDQLERYLQIFYNSPSIKNLSDLLKIRVESYNQELETIKADIKEKEKQVKAYLEEYNTSIDAILTKASAEANKEIKDLLEKDLFLLDYYRINELVDEDKKDFVIDIREQETSYINSLIYAPRGTFKSFYYAILELEQIRKKQFTITYAIEDMEESLEEINNPNSLEHKTNALIEHLLQEEYFKRNIAEIIAQEETAKGNIAQYSNNVLDGLIDYRISFKNIRQSELETTFKEYTSELKELNDKKADLEKKIKDIIIDPETLYTLQEQLKELNEKIKALEEKKLSNGYITIKDNVYKVRYPLESNINLSINETPSSVELKIGDNFIESYPKTFDIQTLKNKQENTITGYLYDLTPDKATKLSSFIRLIIIKASNTKAETIEFNIKELSEKLEIRKGKETTDIRYLAYLLYNLNLTNIKLKTQGKKETITNFRFIDSIYISDGTIKLMPNKIIKELCNINKSKIWTDPKANLSPELNIIDNKTAQLMNQLGYNKTTGEAIVKRNISAMTLAKVVPNFMLESPTHFKELVSEPLYDALERLNKDPYTHYLYNNIKGIKNARKPEELKNYMIETTFKNENVIPSKVIHQEENRKKQIEKDPLYFYKDHKIKKKKKTKKGG